MKKIDYPIAYGGPSSSLIGQGFWGRFRTRRENARVERDQQLVAKDVPLECMSKHGKADLYPDDLPLIFLCRNERKLLPNFLSHYRSLGVSRFICVDDASDDGTTEYLLEQDDVDVWTSTVRYKLAGRGRWWREKLLQTYGGNRWYVNVDSDEFLVYENFQERNLRSVIGALESCGYLRLAAPMLDMYPVNLHSAKVEKLASLHPWDVADHFDAHGYQLRVKKRALSLRGGPRVREFSHYLELMKYPLIYWDEQCSFGSSIHQPLPFMRNFVPIMGALLHFKFFSDFEEKARGAVDGGQYHNSASAYAAILEKMASEGEISLYSAASVKYTGADQLLAMGFFDPIPEDKRDGA